MSISYNPDAHAPSHAHSTGGAFVGSVSNYFRTCRAGRTVRLYKKGHKGVLRHTKSKTSGKWKIPFANAHGRFYALATRKSFIQGNRRVVCASDRSNTIKVK